MKKVELILCMCSLLNFAFAQAQGIFIYENEYTSELGTGKVVTKMYDSKSFARIESSNTSTKNPYGTPGTKDQNVLLYDFDKLTETHMNAVRKTAVITPFTAITTEEMMKKMGTEVTVQNMGQEKIGNYNCTHFVMTMTNTKNKTANSESKKEFWITNDLGIGNIFYVGPYLYYPKGSLLAGKLSDAGAAGIVVRWQVMDPMTKKPSICNLVQYKAGQLPASTFAPPSDYQVISR
jgi:hypothetical protein